MSKNRIIPTLKYNHLEPGQPGNPKPFRICGAQTKGDDAKYEYCAKPAGSGTDHPGAGRCLLHGGSRNPGRYSDLWRGRMKEIARATLENDPDVDPLDLLAELEVQRVILAGLIAQLPPAPGGAGSDLLPSGEPVIMDLLPGEPISGRTSSAALAIQEEMSRPPVMSRNARRKLARQQETGGVGGIVTNPNHIVPVDNPLTEFSSSDNPDNTETGVITAEIRYWKHIEQIRLSVNDIVNTVNKVVMMRNQTAITRSEVAYLVMLLREGMEKFVPKENREPYVRWIMDNIPGMRKKEVEEDIEKVE